MEPKYHPLKELTNVYGSKYLKSMCHDIVSEGYPWSLSIINNLFSNKPANGWGLQSQAWRLSYPFILLQGVGSRTITERLVEFSTLATQAQAFPRADPNANSNHQPATLVSTNIAGWKMDPKLKMYFLLKMGIFQPAMLVLPKGIYTPEV